MGIFSMEDIVSMITYVKSEKWNKKWNKKMVVKRLLIARAMHRNPRVTATELADMLKINISNTDKHLKVMREAGCIRRVGPAKGGRWEVVL
jgi:ATP-dependent DNA helicase RecG